MQEVVGLTRAATTRGEADVVEDYRGASAPPLIIRTPCGGCGESMEINDRFASSG